SRLEPKDHTYLNGVGVARYRLGQYAEALDTLTRAESLATKDEPYGSPANLAFLAMANHQLGKHDKARAALDKLYRVMRQPRWTRSAEFQRYLHEASQLMETPVERRARAEVEGRWKRRLDRTKVLTSLREDRAIRDEVREHALILARRMPDDARSFEVASWTLLREPAADKARYRLALRHAE